MDDRAEMSRVYFFVDRITSGIATLIPGEGNGSAEIRADLLPDGTREGDWLRASFYIDGEKQSEITREIGSLMDDLEK